jgi:hypothetical protein
VTMKGRTGRAAPAAKETKLDTAAPAGEPRPARSGSASANASVVAPAGDVRGPVGVEPPQAHEELQLGHRTFAHEHAHLLRRGRPVALQELELRPHRDVLPGGHRTRPGDQPGQPGEEHHVAADVPARHAGHQRQVGDEPVVEAEHQRPQRSRRPGTPGGKQPGDQLSVDELVGGHVGGGFGLAAIAAPLGGLHPLQERHDGPDAEAPGEP